MSYLLPQIYLDSFNLVWLYKYFSTITHKCQFSFVDFESSQELWRCSQVKWSWTSLTCFQHKVRLSAGFCHSILVRIQHSYWSVALLGECGLPNTAFSASLASFLYIRSLMYFLFSDSILGASFINVCARRCEFGDDRCNMSATKCFSISVSCVAFRSHTEFR